MTTLVRRQRERRTLAAALTSSEPELVCVYGRRRIGKTFLVREFFAKGLCFEAQVDLLIDRKDATINLCEMKFSEAEFVIDKRYAGELRSKRDVFRRVTKTKKAVLVTMVTTYGVRQNPHRDELVAASVEMGALFAP